MWTRSTRRPRGWGGSWPSLGGGENHKHASWGWRPAAEPRLAGNPALQLGLGGGSRLAGQPLAPVAAPCSPWPGVSLRLHVLSSEDSLQTPHDRGRCLQRLELVEMNHELALKSIGPHLGLQGLGRQFPVMTSQPIFRDCRTGVLFHLLCVRPPRT